MYLFRIINTLFKTIHEIKAITNLEGYKNIDILSPTVLLESEG